MNAAARILIGIAIAPLVAALGLAALLVYGAWCATDFVIPKKDNNA